jgi:hypothetical protein
MIVGSRWAWRFAAHGDRTVWSTASATSCACPLEAALEAAEDAAAEG